MSLSFLRHLLIGLLLGSAIAVLPSNAQKLIKADFSMDILQADSRFDSTAISINFGPVRKVERIVDSLRSASPQTTFIYSFDSLTIAVDRHFVRWFETTSRSVVTRRGVRVGDSVMKVHRLYGKPSGEDWLDCHPSYFRRNSTLGVAFCIVDGRVAKIVVGWGST